MGSLIRKLRGLVGMGAFTGVAWTIIGAAVGTAVMLIDPASIDPGESPLWIAYYFGRAGFVCGVVAGVVVAVVEGRRDFGRLSVARMAIWGALAGLALPWLAAGPRAMLPLFGLMGAGTVSLALAIARRGASRGELVSGEDTRALGAAMPSE